MPRLNECVFLCILFIHSRSLPLNRTFKPTDPGQHLSTEFFLQPERHINKSKRACQAASLAGTPQRTLNCLKDRWIAMPCSYGNPSHGLSRLLDWPQAGLNEIKKQNPKSSAGADTLRQTPNCNSFGGSGVPARVGTNQQCLYGLGFHSVLGRQHDELQRSSCLTSLRRYRSVSRPGALPPQTSFCFGRNKALF